MAETLLVLNAGSSSIKFRLFAVGGTADETIRHLAELNRSMGKLDEAIVEIMLSKGAMRA